MEHHMYDALGREAIMKQRVHKVVKVGRFTLGRYALCRLICTIQLILLTTPQQVPLHVGVEQQLKILHAIGNAQAPL